MRSIVLARKPVGPTVAETIVTGGACVLNVDATRVGGRWPSNVVLTAPVARSLDAEVGVLTSGRPVGKRSSPVGYGGNIAVGSDLTGYGESGGASRFFKVLR